MNFEYQVATALMKPPKELLVSAAKHDAEPFLKKKREDRSLEQGKLKILSSLLKYW